MNPHAHADLRTLPFWRIAAMLASVLTLSMPAIAFAEAKRAYDIDDHLKLESVGAAMAHPQSGIFAWEQSPRYDALPDYSFGHSGAWSELGGQLMSVDIDSPTPAIQPLATMDAQRMYWLDSYSPTGRFVAFYSAKDGRIDMGAVDTTNNAVSTFPAAPRIHWRLRHRSVWISSEEFVFAAHVEGGQPAGLATRRYTGERFEKAWLESWRGREPSVSEVSSRSEPHGGEALPGRLMKANARTGEMSELAEGWFENLAVSPDGRYLAALRQYDLAQPDPSELNVDWITSRSELIVIDLKQPGRVQRIASGKDVFPGTLAWASDRNRLAFFAWDVGARVQSGVFHALDANSGEVIAHPHVGLDLASKREQGYEQQPEQAVWVGNRLAVLARVNPDGESTPRFTYREVAERGVDGAPVKADWFLLDSRGRHENLTKQFQTVAVAPLYADGRSLGVLADGHAWKLRPRRPAIKLTAQIDGEVTLVEPLLESVSHKPFTPLSLVQAHHGDSSALVMIDWSAESARSLMRLRSQDTLLSVSTTGRAALLRSDDDAGLELFLQYADGRRVTLTRLNAHLGEIARTTFKHIEYEVNAEIGKRTLEGCMLLPHDYKPGRRYPVIVEVYPSSGSRCPQSKAHPFLQLGSRTSPYTEHLLASHGYIVFWANTSRAVTRTDAGPINEMPRIVEQGIDALVAQGYADPDRIGLFGFSQGGFASLFVAAQSQRFRAVVSMHGWVDMYSNYFENHLFQKFHDREYPFVGSAARYEATAGTDFGIGRSAWQVPEAYVRNSPLFHARSLTTPTLLIHSDMDGFALSQYEMMFTALYRLRRDARLLRYWGEGHGPSSPANIRHLWENTLDWYDTHLGVSRSSGTAATEPASR